MFAGKFFCICCICMLPAFIDSGDRFFWCLNSSSLPSSSHHTDSRAASTTTTWSTWLVMTTTTQQHGQHDWLWRLLHNDTTVNMTDCDDHYTITWSTSPAVVTTTQRQHNMTINSDHYTMTTQTPTTTQHSHTTCMNGKTDRQASRHINHLSPATQRWCTDRYTVHQRLRYHQLSYISLPGQ